MDGQIISKRCSRCKQIKHIFEFNKDKQNKDGFRGYCKICQMDIQANYRQSENGKVIRNRYRLSEKGKVANRRYKTCRPNQIKAGNAVIYAIRNGKLISPKFLLCHYCPKPAQQYHHWHGYEKEYWLDVIPVCIKCHNKQLESKEFFTPLFLRLGVRDDLSPSLLLNLNFERERI